MTDYTIYRLFDFETGHYIGGEFKHIRDFFDYHIEHTFPPNVRGSYRMMEFLNPRILLRIRFDDNYGIHLGGRFHEHYAIKDAYGANYLEPQDLYHLAYDTKLMYHFSYRWFYNYEWNDPNLFKPKNNVNNLKRETWSWVYRGPHTTNEIRQNHGHINDYGESMVRGCRRGYNLPTSRDSSHNSCWHSRKSWKHNSKRKHQWKEK